MSRHADEALTELAKLRNQDRITQLVAVLAALDEKGGTAAYAADQLGKLLLFSPAAEIRKARPALVALAQKARLPEVRRAAWAGVITADAKPDLVWNETGSDASARATCHSGRSASSPIRRCVRSSSRC